MRLDTSQQMRTDMRLRMAPRMIQSMEILQLPLMALQERIDQELSENPVLVEFVARQAARCEWVTSVCTGARILLAAGPAIGKRITTHWRAVPELREQGKAAEVLDDVRFVRDGNIVTSAGVSSGSLAGS